ncbi:hypothetical protein HDU93_002373, partial [Gonapodya sp. JEL0774]
RAQLTDSTRLHRLKLLLTNYALISSAQARDLDSAAMDMLRAAGEASVEGEMADFARRRGGGGGGGGALGGVLGGVKVSGSERSLKMDEGAFAALEEVGAGQNGQNGQGQGHNQPPIPPVRATVFRSVPSSPSPFSADPNPPLSMSLVPADPPALADPVAGTGGVALEVQDLMDRSLEKIAIEVGVGVGAGRAGMGQGQGLAQAQASVNGAGNAVGGTQQAGISATSPSPGPSRSPSPSPGPQPTPVPVPAPAATTTTTATNSTSISVASSTRPPSGPIAAAGIVPFTSPGPASAFTPPTASVSTRPASVAHGDASPWHDMAPRPASVHHGGSGGTHGSGGAGSGNAGIGIGFGARTGTGTGTGMGMGMGTGLLEERDEERRVGMEEERVVGGLGGSGSGYTPAAPVVPEIAIGTAAVMAPQLSPELASQPLPRLPHLPQPGHTPVPYSQSPPSSYAAFPPTVADGSSVGAPNNYNSPESPSSSWPHDRPWAPDAGGPGGVGSPSRRTSASMESRYGSEVRSVAAGSLGPNGVVGSVPSPSIVESQLRKSRAGSFSSGLAKLTGRGTADRERKEKEKEEKRERQEKQERERKELQERLEKEKKEIQERRGREEAMSMQSDDKKFFKFPKFRLRGLSSAGRSSKSIAQTPTNAFPEPASSPAALPPTQPAPPPNLAALSGPAPEYDADGYRVRPSTFNDPFATPSTEAFDDSDEEEESRRRQRKLKVEIKETAVDGEEEDVSKVLQGMAKKMGSVGPEGPAPIQGGLMTPPVPARRRGEPRRTHTQHSRAPTDATGGTSPAPSSFRGADGLATPSFTMTAPPSFRFDSSPFSANADSDAPSTVGEEHEQDRDDEKVETRGEGEGTRKVGRIHEEQGRFDDGTHSEHQNGEGHASSEYHKSVDDHHDRTGSHEAVHDPPRARSEDVLETKSQLLNNSISRPNLPSPLRLVSSSPTSAVASVSLPQISAGGSPVAVPKMRIRVHVTETINAMSAGGHVNKILVTGEVSVGVVAVEGGLANFLATASKRRRSDPPIFRLKISNPEYLERIIANEQFLTVAEYGPSSAPSTPISGVVSFHSGEWDCDAASLAQVSLSSNPETSADEEDITQNQLVPLIKYQVRIDDDAKHEFAPLVVRPLWKTAVEHTDLLVGYNYSGRSRLATLGGGATLSNVEVMVTVGGSAPIGNARMKPLGLWNAEKRALLWRVPDSSGEDTTEDNGPLKLLARFETPEASEEPGCTPGTVVVRFTCSSALVSGIDVNASDVEDIDTQRVEVDVVEIGSDPKMGFEKKRTRAESANLDSISGDGERTTKKPRSGKGNVATSEVTKLATIKTGRTPKASPSAKDAVSQSKSAPSEPETEDETRNSSLSRESKAKRGKSKTTALKVDLERLFRRLLKRAKSFETRKCVKNMRVAREKIVQIKSVETVDAKVLSTKTKILERLEREFEDCKRLTVDILLPPLMAHAREHPSFKLLHNTPPPAPETTETPSPNPLLESIVAKRILSSKVVAAGIEAALTGKKESGEKSGEKTKVPTSKDASKASKSDVVASEDDANGGDDGNASDAPSLSSLPSYSSMLVGSSDEDSDSGSDPPPVDDWMDEDDNTGVWGQEANLKVEDSDNEDKVAKSKKKLKTDAGRGRTLKQESKAKLAVALKSSDVSSSKSPQKRPATADSVLKGGKKKNRMGQRARRLEYERLYGENAKLKPLPPKQQSTNAKVSESTVGTRGVDAPSKHDRKLKSYVSDVGLNSKVERKQGSTLKPAVTQANLDASKPVTFEVPADIHPSWKAKLEQKKAEEARKALAGTAKKIVFDDEED